MPESREEELSRSLEELEMAKLRLESLSRQAELLQASLSEHARAIETIRAFSALKEGTEILIPVGAGTFLPARSAGATHAIVGIGAGVSVEKGTEEALAKLEKDAAEIELAQKKIIQELRNVEKQAGLLSQKIQTLQRELEEGEADKGLLEEE
ncbi:MAG: prefoldin subunit alpha [Thermoplasmata archaeon]